MRTDKNLSTYFEYYKNGTITEFTLCQEIAEAIDANVNAEVIIYNETPIQAAPSFIAALLPIRGVTGYKVKYIIDRKAIDSKDVTNQDIVDCVLKLRENEGKIIFKFTNLLKNYKYNEMSLRDALEVYVKIYEYSRDVLPTAFLTKAQGFGLFDKDSTMNILMTLNDYNESVEHILEIMKLKNIIPDQFVEEAKKLVVEKQKIVLSGSDEVPSENILTGILTKDNPEVNDIFRAKDYPADAVLKESGSLSKGVNRALKPRIDGEDASDEYIDAKKRAAKFGNPKITNDELDKIGAKAKKKFDNALLKKKSIKNEADVQENKQIANGVGIMFPEEKDAAEQKAAVLQRKLIKNNTTAKQNARECNNRNNKNKQ